MGLQQVPELANRRFIRRWFTTQINADKAAHGTRVIQCLFNRRIRQAELVSPKMNAQHPLQTHRQPACSFTFHLWIKRFDHLAQISPRNDLIHLQQKRLPTRSRAKTSKTIIGERLLTNYPSLRSASNDGPYYNRSLNKSEIL